MKSEAIIFDLDGTLIDSIVDIAACGNEALASMGFPGHSVETYKTLVGDGIVGLATKVLPQAERKDDTIARFVETYRALYAGNWAKTTAPYPGVTSLLAELLIRGVKLAVLSNKRDDFTKICVERLLPAATFVEVRGESEVTPKKPDPRGALEVASRIGVPPSRCLFVGDSEIDVETAQRAGMAFVAVDWGYRSREELQEAGARRFASSPDDLLLYV